ncbi:hypothetical protein KIH81_09625 [Bifidobacterium sp. 82T25]|nr:hypothetical protein [Bifidobacterium miconisargentati]
MRIPGLFVFLSFVVYASVIGFVFHPARDVVRDLYYIVPSLVWIFIGYELFRREHDNDHRSLLRTLYLFGGFVSLSCLVQFALHITFDFSAIRQIFDVCVYEIGFILPILAFERFVLKRIVFSKGIDAVLLLLMMCQIALSFGRIAILEPLLVFAVLSVLSLAYLEDKGRILKAVAVIAVSLCVLTAILLFALPESMTATFVGKIAYSATEINTKQDIDSVTSAMNNWRAYEMQAATKQWLGSDFLNKLFGQGLGKGIEIQFVPYNWVDMVTNNEIPLAHNGLYTLLPKGGLFAVFALLTLFVGAVLTGLRGVRRDVGELREYDMILIAIMVGGFANLWVVRGPISSDTFIVWSLLTGWIYAARLVHE